MMAGIDWISPTKAAGLVAYLVSFGACAFRWRATAPNGRGRGQSWPVLCVLQLGLLLDVAFDLRWKLHAFWMGLAQSEGVYGERRSPQLIALLALAGLLTFGCWWLRKRLRGRPGEAVAAIGTTLSLGLWCCEMLSYHYMDMLLYASAGGLMAVSFLWIGLAVVTAFGARLDGRSVPAPVRARQR